MGNASWTDRFAYMIEHILDASQPRGRVDLQVGVVRCRRWSDEIKGRIVAGSYAPGAIVSEVAAVVRAVRGVDPAWLREVLRAVKAAT